MKKLFAVLALCLGFAVNAQTIVVLNPGSAQQYAYLWCGSYTLNEYADGFDESGNSDTVVAMTNRCFTGGRGGKYRFWLACWNVKFNDSGAILSKTLVSQDSWLQGASAHVPCVFDQAATYTRGDGATLATQSFPISSGPGAGPNYRAVLTLP